MLNRRTFAAALSVLVLAGASAFAQTSTWKIDPLHSAAEFQARHLAVSNVHGSLTKINGVVTWDEKDVSKSSVTATIDVNSLNTNVADRDKHLKSPDFFDVEKNPTITFKSTSVKQVNGKLQVTGDLTMVGVTKQITLDVDGPTPPQKNMEGKLVTGFSMSGVIKRSDYSLGPKFPAAVIGEDIKFSIDVEAGKQ